MPDLSFQRPAVDLSEEEAQAKLAVQSEAAQANQAATLSQAAEPATEPLDPARVNSLGETLTRALGAMSGGQITPEMVGAEKVAEPLDVIPPKIFAGVAALSAVLGEMGQEAFDPVALTTSNQGIAELSATIDQISQDPAVAEAMQAPQQAPAAAPPEQVASASPEEDLDRFVQ